ncbi:MAG: hypothetical protein NVS4B6_09220 [Mycobacterium sp.]
MFFTAIEKRVDDSRQWHSGRFRVRRLGYLFGVSGSGSARESASAEPGHPAERDCGSAPVRLYSIRTRPAVRSDRNV